MDEPKTGIVLPDMQCPEQDNITLRAVEAYMAEHVWDLWVNLGDFLDFKEISTYEERKKTGRDGAIAKNYDAGNALLDRHQKIIRGNNPDAEMVLLQGNHDYRIEAYKEVHPEIKKMVDYDRCLRLKERNIRWIKNWEKGALFKKGKAYFAHGSIHNMYHAKHMANRYGVCIYYGHTHDVMEIPVERLGDNSTVVGKSLGCLCKYNQKYLKGNPTKWQQAFAVFYFFPDGYYTEHTVRIFKHRFVSPEGKVYDGGKIKNA
jgi:predicted phosphodiesterase